MLWADRDLPQGREPSFMRIGVFGGTFDPVHYGHLLIAESCREELSLERVLFIPAALPPHKQFLSHTSGQIRAEMLALALSGYPEFAVDSRELRRDGPSWTVDTLRELKAEFPGAELFLLMGADSLRDLMTWKSPQTIAELAHIVVCNRPGIPVPLKEQILEWVGQPIANRVIAVGVSGIDVAATELRQRARTGRSLRFRTPRAVEVYIRQHKVYSDSEKECL